MTGLYRLLMGLYPSVYRVQFGEEMVSVFEALEGESAGRRRTTRYLFYLREITGLLSGAFHEHLRTAGSAWFEFPTRRFTMRNGFRFPKATAVLMTIILAGIVVAIRKGEAISASLPHVSEPVGPIQSTPSTLLPGVIFFLVLFWSAGLIGWAILFAMHRSGVHRLTEMTLEQK